MITVEECLDNAIINSNPVMCLLAKEQISNALKALQSGYGLDDSIDEFLESEGM
jgi:hypothetical protein